MKVKANVSIAGVGFSYTPGQEYEVADPEAERLIAAGQVSAVDPDYKPKVKPQPVTLDKTPSQPVENVDTVQPPAAKIATPGAGASETKPDQSPTGPQTPIKHIGPSAVDAIKAKPAKTVAVTTNTNEGK